MTLAPAARYVCRDCDQAHAGWVPRCTRCHALSSVDRVEASVGIPVSGPWLTSEQAPRPLRLAVVPSAMIGGPAAPVLLSDVPDQVLARDGTGLPPLDVVLGGGLVVGSVVVLGGEPGGGKSSLTMQALAGLGLRALYASGEESIVQAATRARRIGAASNKVWIVAETDIGIVLDHARSVRAQIVAIDSIQTLVCPDLAGGAGSPGQVRECANRLVQFAKATDTSVWIVGHVTNDGALAGPKTLKHLVDVVLDLEAGPDRGGTERILRCTGKNRFGPSNAEGRFELTDTGMVTIDGDGWNEAL